jgi:hypothetical protein
MKATPILAGVAWPHEAWATMNTGAVQRLEFHASTQPEALATAFALAPKAIAMSLRRTNEEPTRQERRHA